MADGISKERAQEIAAEIRTYYEQAVRDSVEQAKRWDAAQRYLPTQKQRAAWFAEHGTSVAEQVSRRPLSSRLIDVAALCFLRGLALAGWVKRRVR